MEFGNWLIGLTALMAVAILTTSASAGYENVCPGKRFPSWCNPAQGWYCSCEGSVFFARSYTGYANCYDGSGWAGNCYVSGGWVYGKKFPYQIALQMNNPANRWRRLYAGWQRY